MDLRHLELLRELADRGTITAVAAATYRSPSAVSQQLRTAERAFGASLVEPDGRGLRLTAAGRLLAEGAVTVSTALERVQRELDELQGRPAGSVAIVGLPSAMEFLLPPLFERLAGSAIDLRLDDADVGEAHFAELAADYDVVIGHTMGAEPHPLPGCQSLASPEPRQTLTSRTQAPADGGQLLSRRVVAREPLDVAVPTSHRLAGRRHVTPSDLAGERWITVPEGYPFDTVRIAIENRAGEPLRIVQRLRDNRLVEALVVAGQGCALLPRFTTRARDGLELIPLSGVRSVRSIVALGRPDRLERAAVRAVVEELATIGAALR